MILARLFLEGGFFELGCFFPKGHDDDTVYDCGERNTLYVYETPSVE